MKTLSPALIANFVFHFVATLCRKLCRPQSQRDYSYQPRVATKELPWVTDLENHTTLKGLHPSLHIRLTRSACTALVHPTASQLLHPLAGTEQFITSKRIGSDSVKSAQSKVSKHGIGVFQNLTQSKNSGPCVRRLLRKIDENSAPKRRRRLTVGQDSNQRWQTRLAKADQDHFGPPRSSGFARGAQKLIESRDLCFSSGPNFHQSFTSSASTVLRSVSGIPRRAQTPDCRSEDSMKFLFPVRCFVRNPIQKKRQCIRSNRLKGFFSRQPLIARMPPSQDLNPCAQLLPRTLRFAGTQRCCSNHRNTNHTRNYNQENSSLAHDLTKLVPKLAGSSPLRLTTFNLQPSTFNAALA